MIAGLRHALRAALAFPPDTLAYRPVVPSSCPTPPRAGKHARVPHARRVAIMLSKPPPPLLLCAHGLPLRCPRPSAPAPPACPTSCRRPPSHGQAPQTRSFAQHAAAAAHCNEPDLSWPDPVHPHKTPTPYQILDCRRGEAYTKQRFYALVKLYHPDRGGAASPVAHLPHAVRLERYRLLVAAHTILADDAKRRAYDAWGYGWAGHHHAPSHAATAAWAPEPRQWPSGQDPMRNATWEDWERWYQRENDAQDGGPHDAYVSNFTFVTLVLALVSIGGIMQGTRASLMSSSIMERRDKTHREASMELSRSKRATISGDRDERIKTFLDHRQAVLAGEDAYQRLLPPSETCAADSTVRKS